MTRRTSSLSHAENCSFEKSTHLYSTNIYVALHNKHILKHLNMAIVHCLAEKTYKYVLQSIDDEQLPLEVLLAIGQQVMLTANLWVGAGLVNDSLGKSLTLSTTPMNNLLAYHPLLLSNSSTTKEGLWDASNLTYVPISPITRGTCRKPPLRMAWGLTIHKAQGMTLQNETINIGNIDRQGLTFTTISRVTSLSGLHISPPFSFSRYSQMQGNRRKQEESLLASKYLKPNCG